MIPTVNSKHFGMTPNGGAVTLYTFSLQDSIAFSVMNYGATWTHCLVPGRDGKLEDVVLGFDSLDGYLQSEYLDNYCYLGSSIGQVAGRISENQFILDGKTYHLPANHGDIHLHGGIEGWDKKLWKATEMEAGDVAAVRFNYESEEEEEGYPGIIRISITYALNQAGDIIISYDAVTDKKTIINPTNHAYFNLSGNFTQPISDHQLQIDAQKFLPISEDSLPTGEILAVDNTVFDFQKQKSIREALSSDSEQLKFAGGIDHCFKLESATTSCVLLHPSSGRKLTIDTLAPGIQVYTGNYLSGAFEGKKGVRYGKHAAICLETQSFPDSPTHDNFTSIEMEPGKSFHTKTVYRFDVLN